MRIISWNVNGIRAAEKKDFFKWMQDEAPDVCCLQETKANPEQLTKKFLEQEGYKAFFESAEKKGYSGVAVYSKIKPKCVYTLGDKRFDSEGRSIFLEFDDFTLINCYFPNSQNEGKRLPYKIAFCSTLKKKLEELVASGKNIVLCGDYNIAHKEIDLARPKQNEKNPGFLPEERAWMTKFLEAGFVDVFREFNKEPDNYTWWSYRANARANNVGWRIDYFCVNSGFLKRVKSATILSDVMESDHCPIDINL